MEGNNQNSNPTPVQGPTPAQVPVVPTPTNETKQQSKLLKILIIIFGIIILLVVLFFAFNAFIRKQELTPPNDRLINSNKQTVPSPTPDLTAGWKTYTNTTVGYQLKYPENFPLPILAGWNGSDNSTNGTEDSTSIQFGNKAEEAFSLETFPYDKTLEDLVAFSKTGPMTPQSEVSSEKTLIKKSVTIGNLPAWMIINHFTNPVQPLESNHSMVLFVGNKHQFIFYFGPNYTEESITKVISTFKFTK